MPDDELLEAMRRETRLFMGAVFRENRSILDFIDGRFTFVNGPLARFEQEVLPRGERDYKVTLTKVRKAGRRMGGSAGAACAWVI